MNFAKGSRISFPAQDGAQRVKDLCTKHGDAVIKLDATTVRIMRPFKLVIDNPDPAPHSILHNE